MRIGIVGLGMVGGAIRHGFVKIGHDVAGFDIKDPQTSLQDVLESDVCFVCVPTPTNDEGFCDISIVRDVVRQLDAADYQGLITIKSTVPPGTTEQLARMFPRRRLSFCPEFLREKAAYTDFVEQHDLCVAGVYEERDFDLLKEAHGPLPQNMVRMRPSEAELTKYFSNVYNATRIIFANQFYDVCKAMGVNYNSVKDAMVLRNTISNAYLDCNENFRGFGGTCLPKDTQAFVNFAKQLGLPARLFELIVEENKRYKTTLL